MKTQLQNRDIVGSRPAYYRVLIALLAIVFSVGSVQQAAHSHGRAGSTDHSKVLAAQGSDNTGNDAGCPLCVAMHSAAPAAPQTIPAVALIDVALFSAHSEGGISPVWSFTLFGRPPPSFLL